MVKPVLAEVRDQILHAAVALALMALFYYQPVFLIAAVVIGIGLVRELLQHGWRDYGAMDMIFWAVGCVIFIVLYYVFIVA